MYADPASIDPNLAQLAAETAALGLHDEYTAAAEFAPILAMMGARRAGVGERDREEE